MNKALAAIAGLASAAGIMLVGSTAEAAPSTPATSAPSAVAEGTRWIANYPYEWQCDYYGSAYIDQWWPAYTSYDCTPRNGRWDLWVNN